MIFPIAMSLASTLSNPCTMGSTVDPNCFRERLAPAFKVTLVSYGNQTTYDDLSRIGKLLKVRFGDATNHIIDLEIVDQAVIPLPNYSRDVSDVRAMIKGSEEHREISRLNRIWYYYNVEPEGLVNEIQSELSAGGMSQALNESDAVLVVSGPQFEGLGFAMGGYGLTEQPSEVAWQAYDGGRTDQVSDVQLVDELTHETGHILGLDHAAAQCFAGTTQGLARYQCCIASPGGQDVMSYCRDRSQVSETHFFKFTQCTQDFLKNTVQPLLLSGGARTFQKAPCP